MSAGYDTAGPIARSAEDCSVAFAALSGVSSLPVDDPAAGLRVGLPRLLRAHPPGDEGKAWSKPLQGSSG
jgi:Asp-tRNA(Asn)/Glu-tRNA(Gln) amidotransferase A subunit family amidase